MPKNSPAPETFPEREILVSRLIAAPPALVYQAWSDPKAMNRWWGPRGFDAECEMDFKVGGKYRWVMRDAEGAQYPMSGSYLDLVPGQRIVYTGDLPEHPPAWHAKLNALRGSDGPIQDMIVTVTFEDQGGKTLMSIRSLFESTAVRDAFAGMGMVEGWGQSLDKFEAQLASLA
jgi:uncharacterized protein YndB with AHSA1/START domain